MWSAVLAAVIEDFRKDHESAISRMRRGINKPPYADQVIREARIYFAGRDARIVCSNAGFDDLRIDLVLKRITGGAASRDGRWSEGREPKGARA